MYIGVLKHAGKVVGGGMWPENGGLGITVEETLDTWELQAACFWPAMKVKKTPRQKDKSMTQSESSIHRFLLPTAVDLAVVGWRKKGGVISADSTANRTSQAALYFRHCEIQQILNKRRCRGRDTPHWK